MNDVNFENIDNNAQYQSFKAAIEAHAEEYSFNIESVLFPQLTEEQQKLWRKEIEQACISGGDAGVSLARDLRYKENKEYIRKDTLIEKACEWIMDNYLLYPNEDCADTKKFIEDFKKYMNG